MPESLERMRSDHEAMTEELGGEPVAVAEVRDEDAGGVPVRLYVPRERDGGVLVYLHGGGWAIGSPASFDRVCRRLADASRATVVSVGYRLAPEHPYPAAVRDAEAALRWAAERFAGEPLAVGGDSAGGNLAAVLARRARDAGGPALALQLLIYPVCDVARDTPSYATFAEGFYLSAEIMGWYVERYGGDPADPDVAPLRAASLEGVAPAHVLVASHDVLRDEGEAYAARLREAGVPVTLEVAEGMVHGFVRWTGAIDAAGMWVRRLGAAVRAALDAG